MHRLQVKGEVNIDSTTLGFSLPDGETLVPPIQALQSCLRVGKSNTASAASFGTINVRARKASAAIPHDEMQLLTFLFCLD